MKSWVLNYEEKLAVSTCSYWDVSSIEDILFLGFPIFISLILLPFLKYFLENILANCHTDQLRVMDSIIFILSYILWVFFKPWNTMIFLFSPSFLSYSFLPKSNHVLVWSFSFSHSKIFLFSNSSKNKIVMKLLL